MAMPAEEFGAAHNDDELTATTQDNDAILRLLENDSLFTDIDLDVSGINIGQLAEAAREDASIDILVIGLFEQLGIIIDKTTAVRYEEELRSNGSPSDTPEVVNYQKRLGGRFTAIELVKIAETMYFTHIKTHSDGRKRSHYGSPADDESRVNYGILTELSKVTLEFNDHPIFEAFAKLKNHYPGENVVDAERVVRIIIDNEVSDEPRPWHNID